MKDMVDKKEFNVKYCSTERMLADFYTKPTQGSLFKRLSSVIMGEISLAKFNNLVGSKERVENKKIGKMTPTRLMGRKGTTSRKKNGTLGSSPESMTMMVLSSTTAVVNAHMQIYYVRVLSTTGLVIKIKYVT